MPFIRQSQIQKHTPKSIKLTELYKNSIKQTKLSRNDKLNMIKALKSAGYNYNAASRIMDKEITISKAKQVSAELFKAGFAGFTQDTNKIINRYVEKEAIKRKNIANRRRELMHESLQEDIYKSKTPGLKTAKKIVKMSNGSSLNGKKPKLGF